MARPYRQREPRLTYEQARSAMELVTFPLRLTERSHQQLRMVPSAIIRAGQTLEMSQDYVDDRLRELASEYTEMHRISPWRLPK